MGMRSTSAMIEWRSRLNGLNDKKEAGRLFPLAGEARTRGYSLKIRGKQIWD